MAIEFQDSQYKGASNPVNNVEAIDVVEIGGNVYAIIGGDDGMLAAYAIDDDPASPTYGELSDTPVGSVADDLTTLHLSMIKALSTIEVDGTTFVVAGGNDSGLSTFSIDAAGQFTNTDNVADDATLLLNNVRAIGTDYVDDGAGGQNAFVFAAGDQDGISVFSIDASGNLTSTANVLDDATTHLMNVKALDTIVVDDGLGGTKTFVIAGGDDEGGISVFEVDAAGTLTNTDNAADDAATYMLTVTAIETFTIGGTAYVAAAGDDDGISFFEIDSAGTLTNLGNVADDATLNLAFIEELYVGVHEGAHTLFVASRDAGLDAFEINVDPGTGAVSLTRVATFDSGTYPTADMRAIDGGNGFVVTADQASDELSSFTVPCFAKGTLILTESGERRVEDLCVGDRLLTADHGLQPLRSVVIRHIVFDKEGVEKHKPVEIKSGSLGNGLPRRNLTVSPQHRMFFKSAVVERLFGVEEAIGTAAGMVSRKGIRRMRGRRAVTYFALLLDRHEIIFAEGAPTESFYPGASVLESLNEEALEAIYAVHPHLRQEPELGIGPFARMVLKRQDVEQLVHAERGNLINQDISPKVSGSKIIAFPSARTQAVRRHPAFMAVGARARR